MHKRGNYFLVIALFSALLLFSSLTYANIDEKLSGFFIYGKPICYDNGQIQFSLKNSERKIFINETIVGIGSKIKSSDDYTKIKGGWYNSDFKEQHVFSSDEEMIFLSEEYMFNSDSDYMITISPRPIDVTDFYISMMTLKIPVRCSGYKHSCRFLNLTIDECYRKGTDLHVFFRGIGENNYSEVNLMDDVKVFLNYQTKNNELNYPFISPERFFEGLGSDHFKITVPLDNKTRHVTSVALKIEGCNEYLYKIFSYKSCGVVVDTDINFTMDLIFEDNNNSNDAEFLNHTEVEKKVSEEGIELPSYYFEDYFTFKVFKFIFNLLPI